MMILCCLEFSILYSIKYIYKYIAVKVIAWPKIMKVIDYFSKNECSLHKIYLNM